jgi:hypothetical protein
MQSDNLTDRVRATGVTTTNKVQHLYDLNMYLGGPIKRDRLWFFAATRFNLHPGSGSAGLPPGMVEGAVGPIDVAGLAEKQSEHLFRHPVVSSARARGQ